MSRLGRSPGSPPTAVVAAAGLVPGERVIAAAHLVAGGWALATLDRLIVVDEAPDAATGSAAPGSVAIGWTAIATATLDGEAGVLDVALVDGSSRVLLLGRGQGDRLARALRERIQHSVLLSRTVELRARRWVRVAARRGRDGPPFMQVVAGPGVDLRGPDVAAAVAEADAAVRDQVGLPPA